MEFKRKYNRLLNKAKGNIHEVLFFALCIYLTYSDIYKGLFLICLYLLFIIFFRKN